EAVAAHDRSRVQEHLRDVVNLHPAFDRAYVTDPDGTEWGDWPEIPETHGRNFAFRDWYKGVTRAGEPYVSEAYVRPGRERAHVVAVAAPVRGPDGRVAAYLVAQNPTTALADWLAANPPGESGTLALIEPDGVLAVGAAGGRVVIDRPVGEPFEVRAALA